MQHPLYRFRAAVEVDNMLTSRSQHPDPSRTFQMDRLSHCLSVVNQSLWIYYKGLVVRWTECYRKTINCNCLLYQDGAFYFKIVARMFCLIKQIKQFILSIFHLVRYYRISFTFGEETLNYSYTYFGRVVKTMDFKFYVASDI